MSQPIRQAINVVVPVEADLAPLAETTPLPPCMRQPIRQATKVSILVAVGLAPLPPCMSQSIR